jgi:cell division protein FtsQ
MGRPGDDVIGSESVASVSVMAGRDDGGRRSARTPDPERSPTFSIIDDDLPDAVYVEGDLSSGERSGARRVVIVDDDPPTVSAATASRRHGEQRVRDRRGALRRRLAGRRLRVVALLGAALVLVIAALAVLGSSVFGVRMDDVRVTGNVYTDPVRLGEIIDSLVGTPVVLVDTDEVERSIAAIPWVEDAVVRTDFPNGLRIDIRERSPVASYPASDGLFRVLDAQGRVLDVIAGWPFEYLLIVLGDDVALSAGEFAPAGPAAAARLADIVTGSVRDRIAQIEVDAAGEDLRVVLDDATVIRFGAARELFPKLVRLETVLSAGSAPPASVIDVSTDEVTISE